MQPFGDDIEIYRLDIVRTLRDDDYLCAVLSSGGFAKSHDGVGRHHPVAQHPQRGSSVSAIVRCHDSGLHPLLPVCPGICFLSDTVRPRSSLRCFRRLPVCSPCFSVCSRGSMQPRLCLRSAIILSDTPYAVSFLFRLRQGCPHISQECQNSSTGASPSQRVCFASTPLSRRARRGDIANDVFLRMHLSFRIIVCSVQTAHVPVYGLSCRSFR